MKQFLFLIAMIVIILLFNLLYFTNKNKILKQNPFSLLYSYEEDEKYYLTAYNLLKQKNIKFYIFDENNILDKTKKDIFNRTKKLFYVCCTRAKENLIVFIQINNQKINKEKIISNAKELFGEGNVISGDELINNI